MLEPRQYVDLLTQVSTHLFSLSPDGNGKYKHCCGVDVEYFAPQKLLGPEPCQYKKFL